MRTMTIAVLCLGLMATASNAGQGTTTVCDYRKTPPVCGKVYVPDPVPDRVGVGGGECAATGTQDGPDGCVVLRSGETAPPDESAPLVKELPEDQLPAPPAKLLVPLTDEQQELPTIAAESEDYVEGIEKPSTPPAEKQITDQVPAQQ